MIFCLAIDPLTQDLVKIPKALFCEACMDDTTTTAGKGLEWVGRAQKM